MLQVETQFKIFLSQIIPVYPATRGVLKNNPNTTQIKSSVNTISHRIYKQVLCRNMVSYTYTSMTSSTSPRHSTVTKGVNTNSRFCSVDILCRSTLECSHRSTSMPHAFRVASHVVQRITFGGWGRKLGGSAMQRT